MSSKIDINRASPEEIQETTGIRPGMAHAIAHWREEHGGFASFEDLKKVPRINGQTIDRLKANAEVKTGEETEGGYENEARVNLNRAEWYEIAGLPGITEKTADAIVEYRQAQGAIHSFEDLMNVAGIGPKTIEKIRAEVSFDR